MNKKLIAAAENGGNIRVLVGLGGASGGVLWGKLGGFFAFRGAIWGCRGA